MPRIAETTVIPDSKLARAITDYIRDTETELLFNHSSRVYQFGALAGLHRGLKFDRELLYAGAMFHDIGLMPGMAARMSASKSTARTPRVIFSAATAFRNRTPTRCGLRSRSTPRRACRSTCIRSSRW